MTMVPDTKWNDVAREFGARQGPQAILCVTCVRRDGTLTPPPQIVIFGGQSYCLDDLP